MAENLHFILNLENLSWTICILKGNPVYGEKYFFIQNLSMMENLIFLETLSIAENPFFGPITA